MFCFSSFLALTHNPVWNRVPGAGRISAALQQTPNLGTLFDHLTSKLGNWNDTNLGPPSGTAPPSDWTIVHLLVLLSTGARSGTGRCHVRGREATRGVFFSPSTNSRPFT